MSSGVCPEELRRRLTLLAMERAGNRHTPQMPLHYRKPVKATQHVTKSLDGVFRFVEHKLPGRRNLGFPNY
jgi:hypothetical protein